jgi:hypothetical protein
MVQVEADDGFFLPPPQPEIAGYPTVVLIHSSISLPLVVELAHGNAQPRNESAGTDLGLLRPNNERPVYDIVSSSTPVPPVTFVISFWTSPVQSHTGHAIINLKLGIRSFFQERRKNYRYHDRRWAGADTLGRVVAEELERRTSGTP